MSKLTDKIETSIKFIEDKTKEAMTNKLVLGLSGGLDSAVALVLAISAVGRENIKCYMLPYFENENHNDAVMLAKELEVDYKIISINDIVDCFKCDNDIYRKGNIMARVRMTILYDKAMKHKALVLGTNNFSEYMTGYFTKWGDGVSDLEPLMNFTKTELFEVAKLIGLPKAFYTKKPSADLWEGQTDESEMKLSYEDIDKIINNPHKARDSDVLRVFTERMFKNEHKIKPIPTTINM